jgi:hypothetical protein
MLSLIGAGLVALAGLALSAAGDNPLGVIFIAIGFVAMPTVCVVDDAGHRRRGEVSHALWGTGDRSKPRWMP